MNDWKARAEREAAAVLAGVGVYSSDYLREQQYARLVQLVALGWLQGAIFASHLDLSAIEEGFDDARAAL